MSGVNFLPAAYPPFPYLPLEAYLAIRLNVARMENLNLHIITPSAPSMKTYKTNPTRENPRDFLVSDVGR